MSTPINVKTEKFILLSNSEALGILKAYSERERERTGTVSLLVQRALEYLNKFSRVPPERAGELREKLSSFGFKEKSIIMIMNICPRSIDELRTLLVFEESVYDTSVLEQVLAVLRDYCLEEQ